MSQGTARKRGQTLLTTVEREGGGFQQSVQKLDRQIHRIRDGHSTPAKRAYSDQAAFADVTGLIFTWHFTGLSPFDLLVKQALC